jgi:hypothetical protein
MPDLMAEEVEEEDDERRIREAEIRQLLEGKRYRQLRRGEDPIDVEAELRRMRAEEGRDI